MKCKKTQINLDAIQWTGKNSRNVYEFLIETKDTVGRIQDHGEYFHINFCNGECQIGDLILHTPDGEIKVDIGDYIIKDPFPICCTNKI